MRYHNNKKSSVFVIMALATASMMWIALDSPKHREVVAQSPMDMMNMMMGSDSNMSGDGMMMGGGNMSMPFNMGVVIMPTMCTTPGQLTGMFGNEMFGDDGNATQRMMMGMMGRQMMSDGGMGIQNMSEIGLQQAMNLQICFPMMGEHMQHMQDMMGSGQNSTGGMMNEMMMQ